MKAGIEDFQNFSYRKIGPTFMQTIIMTEKSFNI